jgi:cytochrome P450
LAFANTCRHIIGIYGINSAAPLSSHRRYRRIFRSAFSSSFLRAQEPRFQKHVSALLSVLTSAATTTIPSLAGHSQGVPIDILELLNFTTFDIMGDLTLSQPLGLLASRAYTPWVSAVFASLRVIPLAQVIQHYPVLSALFRLVEPKAVKEMKYRHFRHSADRVDARLARGGEDLNDIWSLVLRSEGSDDALSLEEMYTHADVFMLAGSETTGTAMAGLVYLLLKNPEKMDKVKREVRGAFPDGMGELTMEMAAGRLGYLDACRSFPFSFFSFHVGVG